MARRGITSTRIQQAQKALLTLYETLRYRLVPEGEWISEYRRLSDFVRDSRSDVLAEGIAIASPYYYGERGYRVCFYCKAVERFGEITHDRICSWIALQRLYGLDDSLTRQIEGV